MKKLPFLIFLLIASISLSASMWRFRLGRIAVAEITTASVRVTNSSQHAFLDKYNKTAYAVIIFKLDPKRSISIYDFSLRDNKSNRYPCIALRAGTNQFDGEAWKIDKCDPNSWYSMLFKLEAPENSPGVGTHVEMTLEYSLNPCEGTNLKIPFTFIGNGSLSNVAQITTDGKMPPRP